jgi:hypothetical protein
MNKIKRLSAILAVVSALGAGCDTVKQIGEVNGVVITKITTRDIVAPSTTSVVGHDPSISGTITPINEASAAGLLPAVSTGVGIAAGGALLRPARSGSHTTTTSTRVFGNGNATSGGNSFVPPGHQNNPSPNH